MGATEFFSDLGQGIADAGRDLAVGIGAADKTSAQVHAEENAIKALSEGNLKRGQLAVESQRLAQGIGEFDPASIQAAENWEAYSHEEIYNRNRKLREGKANEGAGMWIEASGMLAEIGSRYSSGIQKKIQGGWEGEAADSAGQVGEPLTKWMEESGQAFKLTGNRIKEAASAAGTAANAVPPPEGPSVVATVASGIAKGPFAPISDAKQHMEQRQQSERQAQETMGRVMGETYKQVDAQMPSYKDVHGKPVAPPEKPPPANVEALPPPVVPPQGMSNNTGVASTTPSGLSNSSSVPVSQWNQTPDGTNSQWAPQPGQHPPGHHPIGRGPGVPPPGGGGVGPVVGPGGFGPGGPGGPGAGGRGGPGGSGRGGVGGAGRVGAGAGAGAGGRAGLGAGAGSGGAGGPGAGGRGGVGSVPGSGSGPGGAGAGAAGGGGSSAGGRGGGMGAGAGRGQGQGGEDEEHERPSWLEEHDDVWLNDMPKVAPPVFGA